MFKSKPSKDRKIEKQILKNNRSLKDVGLLPHTSAPWQQRVLFNFLDDSNVSLDSDMNVLDAASGIGNNLEVLKLLFNNITATDLSQNALDYSKKRHVNYNFEFVKTDLHKINLPSNSFDLIICTEALEHCEKPDVVIKELKRVLKVGGIGIISTQNHFNLSFIVKYYSEKILGNKNWDAWGTHGSDGLYESYISSFQLNRYIRENNLKILKNIGADYLNAWLLWVPGIYQNYNLLDKFPLLFLGKLPIIKLLGMDYFVCFKKEDI